MINFDYEQGHERKARPWGWWNGDSKAWEDSGLPDHEVRRRNALHIVEYAIGKPIERSMEVSGSYKELSTLVEELKQSPEAMRLLPAGLFDSIVNSGQSTAEGKESSRTSDSETNPDSELKTGDAV